MAAASDNPSGFFELASVHRIHEDFLQEISHPWDDPRPISLDALDESTLGRVTDQLVAALRNDLSGQGPYVVKDPRIARLLPIWDRVFAALDLEPYFVIAHRQPGEVAASLAERAGCSASRATSLWLHHILDAELHTRGRHRGFVDYDELMTSPLNALRVLSDQLGVSFPVSPSTAKPQLDAFLSNDLRRHKGTDIDLGSLGEAATTFNRLLHAFAEGEVAAAEFRAAADEHRATLAAEMQPESASIEHASALATRLGRDIDELRGIVDERTRWMRSLSDRLTDIEERMDLGTDPSSISDGGDYVDWMHAITESIRNIEAEHGRWLQQVSNDTEEHAGHILRIQREHVAISSKRSLPRWAAGWMKRKGLQTIERRRIDQLRANGSNSEVESAKASYRTPAELVASIGDDQETDGSKASSNGRDPKGIPAG